MMWHRAAIEAILRKHSRYEMHYLGHPTPLVCQILPALVDDLLALSQEPSWKWCQHMDKTNVRLKELDIPVLILSTIKKDVDSWLFCPMCGADRPQENFSPE